MTAEITSEAIGAEELARAHPYRLLARLLSAPPDGAVLSLIRSLEGVEGVLGEACSALVEAARSADVSSCRDEYQDLFIGVGRGELVPFGSFYLTGFLHEKPLAKLRADLALLGIARADEVCEPEDHIAALCEVMAGLISGELAKADIHEQKRFFQAHIGNWAERFFADLESAKSARFYRSVGTLGRTLLTIEAEGYSYLS